MGNFSIGDAYGMTNFACQVPQTRTQYQSNIGFESSSCLNCCDSFHRLLVECHRCHTILKESLCLNSCCYFCMRKLIIDLGSGNMGMAQQYLDGTQFHPSLEHQDGE